MDVIVGSSTGVVKSIDLQNNSYKNLNFSTNLNKQHENVALCWTNDSAQSEFLCALLNRQLKLGNVESDKFEDLFECKGGDGKICGMEVVENNILTCVESGLIKLWDFTGNDKKVDISAGANCCRMRKSPTKSNLFATGGKENPLRIWDLNAQDNKKPIFTSKNVRHDWLELRVPIWETDFRFLENPDLIATCTGHHFVRLYDRRLQCKRPCVNIDWSDHPFSAISLTSHDRQVVVGSTRGFMGLFDLRSPGKLMHSYKGFSGSISSIEAHSTQPYIASCGLDRFLRIHHVDTKKMIHKIYCKAHLNTLILKKNLSIIQNQVDQSESDLEEEESDQENVNRRSRDLSPDSSNGVLDERDDEIWSKMKSVGKKSKNLKRKCQKIDHVTEEGVVSKRKCSSSVNKRSRDSKDDQEPSKMRRKIDKIKRKKLKNEPDSDQEKEHKTKKVKLSSKKLDKTKLLISRDDKIDHKNSKFYNFQVKLESED